MSVSSSVRKRFQDTAQAHRPLLHVDREGKIRSTTRAARQVLEHPDEAALQSSFFVLLHKRNRRRVMQDLADMVCRGKQRAEWLVQMRTGNDRWRWYRAAAQNGLNDDNRIQIHLRPL